MEYPEAPEKGRYNDYEELTGIGGWLAAFLVLFCLGRILAVFGFIIILSRPGIDAVFASDAGPYLTVSLILGTVFFVLNIVIIVLLIKHKIIFRTLYVISIAANLAVNIILGLILNSSLGIPVYLKWSDIVSLGIQAGWIIYLYQSKRVRNTCLPLEEEGEGYAGKGRPRNDFI